MDLLPFLKLFSCCFIIPLLPSFSLTPSLGFNVFLIVVCLDSFCVSFALFTIRSDQISRSVVSDSLRPHESQHAKPPCPSPAEAESPVLWPPHEKIWLIGKDSDARRDWGQEEKGTTEDEMAELHPCLDGRESGWTPGVGDGQRGLACWIHGVTKSRTWLSDRTEPRQH